MSRNARGTGRVYDDGRKDLVINVALLDHTVNKTLPETLSRLATKAELKDVEGSLRAEIKSVEGSLRAEIKEVEGSLRAEIKEVEGSLRAEIKEVEGNLRAEIKEVEGNLRAEIKEVDGNLRAEIKQSALTQIRWTVGLIVALAGVLLVMQGRQEDRLNKNMDELKQLVIQSVAQPRPASQP